MSDVPFGSLNSAKFKKKKKSESRSRVTKSHHFWVQNGPIAQNDIYFGKTINLIFMYLLAPVIMQNFKKI